MAESNQIRNGRDGQWPVPVTFVLCLLFLAAIGLKVKSDHDSWTAGIITQATGEAEIVAARTREVLTSAELAMAGAARVSAQEAVGLAASLPQVTAVGVFDGNGVPLQPETIAAADLGPMSAAAQLATEAGWTGAVARGGGLFAPAVAVRGGDGTAVVAFLSLADVDAAWPGRRIVIAGDGGAIIAVNPLEGFGAARNVNDALGTMNLNAASPGAMMTVGADSAPLVVAAAPAVPGISVYVARDRAALQASWTRNLLFFALLFLGPILAFLGVYFLVKGQAERFTALRTMTREAERRLRIAIDGAQCGVWDWDLSGDRVYMTQLMAKTFGLAGAGRFEAEDVLAVLPDDDRARLRAALQASIRIGTIDVIIHVPAGGQVRRLQIRGRAAYDRNQAGQVRAIGVAIDLTEQVPSGSNSTATTALPGASGAVMPIVGGTELLEVVLAAVPGACAVWDKDKRLIVANRTFIEDFNLPPELCQRGSAYEDVSRRAAAAVASGGMRPDPDTGAELIDLKSNKSLKLLEHKTRDGGLVSFAIDITRQKADEDRLLRSERQTRSVVGELERAERESAELAEKYNAARLKAEEASAAKSNFLANMSHELRTPLTAIIGFSDMMAKQMHGPLGHDQYLEYIRSIHESGEHLLALIVDVLDMAKVEAGKFEIHPKPTYVDEIIEQVARMVATRAEEKQVELDVDLSDIGQATVDARAIKQILINLVGNAIKFTPTGGRVLIQSRGSVKDIMIRVVDTGIGIPPEDIPRLGRPFEQIENDHSRTHEGTGLGLALCKAFVALHGGTIDISSEVGVGTMISVVLPRHSLSARDAA